MSEFKDMAVTGELVFNMPQTARWFKIIDEPFYEYVEVEEKGQKEKKEKLTIPIQLSNGDKGLYYPNRTSARVIRNLVGSNDFKEWIGNCFVWGKILDQNVFGNAKKVPYVTDKRDEVLTEIVK